ncbi:uncharacterized protein LOC6542257 [Drosophila erecta]|uniref:DUF4174 domain-containing protein n=1 Tax=Drosophila erecta TaxID=7220 RepID=B3NA32_DROER|nr:uncharacterized protein LOC6542257 [Drosophila erecta]EDV57495.2 uncharacterized protein Dere_GG24866 [Drosophila erecta]
MRKLQILGFLCMGAFFTLGTSFADPRVKAYVNDFVFPTEDEHVIPPWQQFTNGHSSQSRDLKLSKCSDIRVEDSSGKARLIFISYQKVEDPLQSLKKQLGGELNLPELVDSIKVVRRGKNRLVFDMPSALDALFTLNSYCNLYRDRHDFTYEIITVE